MNVELSTIINRPVAEVFAYVTDHKRQAEWDSAVKEVRQTPEGEIRIGTTLTDVRTFMGRKIESISEVIEWEPNKKFTRRGEKPFPLTGYLTFEPVSEGTNFTWRFEGQPSGFFALADGLITNAFKKALESNLSSLKANLENEVAVYRG
jgi:uncharacterized protein YndB with AHSA1/START domain